MRSFISWLDRRHFVSVRSFTLYASIWLTWRVSEWAFAFAHIANGSGVETAAIIGAVTGPATLLQGAVFKFYMDAKQ